MLLYQKNVSVNIFYQPFETSDVFILKIVHLSDGFTHGLINHQGTKAKCRHLKKIYVQRDFAAGVYHSL